MAKKKKKQILSNAHKNKIYLRPVWRPLHKLSYFKSMPRMKLDQANTIYASCINLPSSAFNFLIIKFI